MTTGDLSGQEEDKKEKKEWEMKWFLFPLAHC